MAWPAEINFGEHTTLVEGARFYLQPGGRKCAPRGVVSMVITVPAEVDLQWPVVMDLGEEISGKAEAGTRWKTQGNRELYHPVRLRP